ncbi:CBM96 family carbohydrate-binding protein [Amycolatopsis japonica]|uniref:CBM96 family carbohydrate-binding protein n=1 Tax=Amycolatopsis japonica TaxID=208439 RepID=UPI003823D0F7
MTLRRSLTLPAVALAVALTVTGGGTAAATDHQRSEVTLSATSWGYVDSATPATAYFKPSGSLPVGTWDTTPHLQRSYVNFDLGSLRGVPFTTVLLSAGETHFVNCDSRATEVWRTSAYTKQSTWQSRPAERTRVASRGADSTCIDNHATFDVTAAVRDAIAQKARHLTLGIRVAEAHEADPAFYRRIESPATLRVVNNAPPATPADLRTNDEPCAKDGTGPLVNYQAKLSARLSDPNGDATFGQFTWWPVADPSQRRTATAAEAYVDAGSLADGTYAWEVYAQDSWGAKSSTTGTCRFTVDRTNPNAPAVTSSTYPADTEGGGVGVAGDFTFSPNGSTDVVRYDYNFGGETREIAAGPDGTATVSFTPTANGWQSVLVRAWDRAGNLSLSTYHSFIVKETRPTVTSDRYPPQGGPDGGIGVPGVFRFAPAAPNVVAYDYRLNDGASATVTAGQDGVAEVTITPATGGEHVLFVRSTDASGVKSPEREYRFLVDASPVVSGPENVDLGTSVTYTAKPRMPHIVEYDYWFASAESTKWTVKANADGTAALPVEVTSTEQTLLRVQARDASGGLSPVTEKRLWLNTWRPTIGYEGDIGTEGRAARYTFTTPMPNATEFEYWLTADPATRWTVPVSGNTATVSYTPPRIGDYEMLVRAKNTAGVWSSTGNLTWMVTNDPMVTSKEFQLNGRVFPGSFTFEARQPGAVAFEYSFDWGPFQRTAVQDGRAVLPWTPPLPPEGSAYHNLRVRTVTADNVSSQEKTYSFNILSAPYVSSKEYPEGEWSGGAGVPGTFTFTPGMPGIVSYTYSVRDDRGAVTEEITVPADGSGTGTMSWTPPDRGIYSVHVRGNTADGGKSGGIGYSVYVR